LKERTSYDEADEGCDDALEIVEKMRVDRPDVAPGERDVETCANLPCGAERVENGGTISMPSTSPCVVVRYQHIADTFGLRTSLTVREPGDALEGAARDESEVRIC